MILEYIPKKIGKEATSMSRNSVAAVSLRKLFPSAQIVGADDIRCDSCIASIDEAVQDCVGRNWLG